MKINNTDWQCHICLKGPYRLDRMYRHLRNVHQCPEADLLELQQGIKGAGNRVEFECDICAKRYFLAINLPGHLLHVGCHERVVSAKDLLQNSCPLCQGALISHREYCQKEQSEVSRTVKESSSSKKRAPPIIIPSAVSDFIVLSVLGKEELLIRGCQKPAFNQARRQAWKDIVWDIYKKFNVVMHSGQVSANFFRRKRHVLNSEVLGGKNLGEVDKMLYNYFNAERAQQGTSDATPWGQQSVRTDSRGGESAMSDPCTSDYEEVLNAQGTQLDPNRQEAQVISCGAQGGSNIDASDYETTSGNQASICKQELVSKPNDSSSEQRVADPYACIYEDAVRIHGRYLGSVGQEIRAGSLAGQGTSQGQGASENPVNCVAQQLHPSFDYEMFGGFVHSCESGETFIPELHENGLSKEQIRKYRIEALKSEKRMFDTWANLAEMHMWTYEQMLRNQRETLQEIVGLVKGCATVQQQSNAPDGSDNN